MAIPAIYRGEMVDAGFDTDLGLLVAQYIGYSRIHISVVQMESFISY